MLVIVQLLVGWQKIYRKPWYDLEFTHALALRKVQIHGL
jgi:hypothetical protein